MLFSFSQRKIVFAEPGQGMPGRGAVYLLFTQKADSRTEKSPGALRPHMPPQGASPAPTELLRGGWASFRKAVLWTMVHGLAVSAWKLVRNANSQAPTQETLDQKLPVNKTSRWLLRTSELGGGFSRKCALLSCVSFVATKWGNQCLLGGGKKARNWKDWIRTCLIFVLKHVVNKSGQSDWRGGMLCWVGHRCGVAYFGRNVSLRWCWW